MVTAGEHWILGLYYSLFLILLIFSLHRLHLVRLIRRLNSRPGHRDHSITGQLDNPAWPHVAIQLPLFNEPAVAGRLIDAVAALEYSGRMEIQVLDDSTDGTAAIVAERVEAARARGVEIRHLRRSDRTGYKAGALAAGMRQTAAELFVVFDADFVPERGVLIPLVRPFTDAAVGMVQARWGHLNREQSALTRVQALYLDAHFAVESAARYRDGRFFNFNGTAGAWRREAIDDAGGWSASTLTEDLDLSYRAQLAGWTFIFLPELEIAGELPATVSGFQMQQHRWARGSIQTCRKNLGKVLAAPVSWKTKLEAVFHLTGNCSYLVTLLLALLLVPSLEIRYRTHWIAFAFIDLILFAICTWSLVEFCREGQRQIGRTMPWRALLCTLPIGIAFSVSNAQAVIEGAILSGGEFRRTFKQGSSKPRAEKPRRIPVPEMLLVLFFAFFAVQSGFSGRWVPLFFLLMCLSGYGYQVVQNLLERAAASAPQTRV